MALSVASSGRRSLAATVANRALTNNTNYALRSIPDDLKKIFIEFKNNTNVKAYEDLVCFIRDYPMEDEELSILLQNSRGNISLLNLSVQHFVHALLKVQWTQRCESTVQDYQEFLVDLLSAHNYYTKVVFEELISTFNNVQEEWDRETSVAATNSINNCVHDVLKVLLQIVPMSLNILKETVEAHFPYLKRSPEEHEYFILNILQILEYQPILRTDFLFLIIDKLIILDVNAPKHEIIATEETPENEQFDMDLDKSVPSMKHSLAETFDCALAVLLNYLSTSCLDTSVSPPELRRESTKRLFQEILNVFDCLILPTHATHHIQFIVFYMCNMKVALADMFLLYLWQKVTSTRVANVMRQSAVAYIGSFLVRSKNVSVRILTNTLTEMSYWIHNYIAKQEEIDCTYGDIRVHPVFYSVCQAIFYVISHRHNEFVNTKKGLLFLQGLNLAKIITCNLNPLNFCLPEIVHNFAVVTRTYQLAYCFTIIENNSRTSLPVVHLNDRGVIHGSSDKEIIDTFFPFDPFLLKKSGHFIHPVYHEVETNSLDESFCSEDSKQDEDDEFLNGYCCNTPTLPIFGISPNF